jgi:Ca-activated chloride channel family protein
MKEIDRLADWKANDGSPLAEAYELLVDEAMAFERRPSPEQYAAFRKATASSRLASRVPVEAKSRGDASQKLIEHVAGDCPPAWLVALDKAGGRHPLHEEVVIGRTESADICVASSQVSRRHAEVFANAGDYWVADLGSTNPTIVNGQALGRAPHKLAPGDVIKVGEVELRYEEGQRPKDT